MAVRSAASPIIRLLPLVPALAIVTGFGIGAMAQSEALLARDCASRDIAVIGLIEGHGEAGTLSADQLYGAALTQLRARSACNEGRVGEALALYDRILDLGPAGSTRR